MAPQRSGRCQRLPHAVRLESRTTPPEDVHRGQVDTEFNPSPSPSGPLASVRFHRPKLKFTEIHQNFTKDCLTKEVPEFHKR